MSAPDPCPPEVYQRLKERSWTDYLTDNPVNAAGLERTLRAISTGKREPPYRLEMETGTGTGSGSR